MSHTTTQLLVATPPTRLQRSTAPTLLAAVKGGPQGPPGAGANSLTTSGDLLGFDGSNADRFPVGSDDEILIADAGEVFGFRWGPQPATSPLTTKGDIYAFDTDNTRLPVGADGQFLRANATPGIGLEWATFGTSDLPAHASTHENGGSDEVDVSGLSGLLADPQTPGTHAATHSNGGSDELTVEDLATGSLNTGEVLRPDGLGGLAMGAVGPPLAHAASHENGGSDEVDVAGLSGVLADPQTPSTHAPTHLPSGVDPLDTAVAVDVGVANAEGFAESFSRADHVHALPVGSLPSHAATHADGGSDEVNVAGLSGVLADAQTPLAHAASHENGGADEVDVAGLSGLLADAQTPLGHAATHLPAGIDPLATATAVEITDATNAEGNAESFARSNHTHAHGARGGGTQHALVTSVVAGFMLGADKAKLDLYPATPAEPLTVLFFRPGGAPGPGVALTWAEVDAFATATQVPWRLVCDSSIVQCEVPSAFDTDFRGLGSITFIIEPSDTHLLIRDGGVIRNIDELQFGSLRCEALTAPGVIADIPGRAMLLLRGGIISNQATSLVAAFEMTTRGVLLAQLGGSVENFAAVPVVNMPDTTAPYIMIQMSSIGGTTWPDNTFSSPAGVVIVAVHDSTARFGTHAAVAGFVLDLPSANPQNIGWNSGSTAARPVAFLAGQPYFDTTLGFQIWWNGAAWVNAVGAVV